MRFVLGICFLLLVVLSAGFAWAQEEPRSWYSVDAVNPGLGDPPEELDRATPRAAMRGFVELSDEGRFTDASHVLNLANIPEEEQSEAGPRLARQLFQVLDRRVWIDWSSLPSRPDAMVENGSEKAQAGQVRRDLGIKLFEVAGRAYEIRLARYSTGEDAEPVWLFSPQTVEDVPPLYELYGPRAFEYHIPKSMQQELSGLRIWEWVAVPILIVLLIGIGWFINWLVGRLAERAPHGFLRTAFTRAGVPLALFVVAIVAQILLRQAISFSGPITSVVQPVLIVVMTSGVGIAALRVVDAILDRITLRYIGEIDDTRSLDKRELYTSIYALRRIIVLLMVGFATVFVLTRLNLFESVGLTLLASAGVLTVLLGIAGQAVLGNILASLQIALAKPVRIGDSVQFEGHWAYVESIFYTFIRLRTWDERRIVVPVKYFVSKPFENWSVKDARIMKTISLTLDHSADASVVREAFNRLVKDQDGVIEPEQADCMVTDHGERGQEVTLYVMAPDPSTGWETEMRLREAMIKFIQENHPDWWPHDRYSRDGTLVEDQD
ncbi:mechanosensitive ion channel family protein [Amaricoccus tamworthensis]|uniref:mechanosensitive ion channel family protein n=1 Tax=Amaricoccus tamworthensis TaxID=57002 RepID=UPI003C7B3B9E